MRISAKDLVQPISEDQPCGENLEYDSDFQLMEAMAQTRSEQDFNANIKPGAEPELKGPWPNWKGVNKQAYSLLERTRDLRVLSYGTVSQLHIEGFDAFKDALEALNACLEVFWDKIYPELDVEDNNDATMRLNTLQLLNDRVMVGDCLKRLPLVTVKGYGSFSFHDIELAEGKIAAEDDETVNDVASIRGAFIEANPDDLATLMAALDGAKEQLTRTPKIWTSMALDTEGLGDDGESSILTPNLDNTLNTIISIQGTAAAYLPDSAELGDEEEPENPESTVSKPAVSAIGGAINNRSDVIRAIDRICDYYATHEPSSPVPLLLRRAQGLVAKSFYEILEDMIPDSVAQARVISGETEPPG